MIEFNKANEIIIFPPYREMDFEKTLNWLTRMDKASPNFNKPTYEKEERPNIKVMLPGEADMLVEDTIEETKKITNVIRNLSNELHKIKDSTLIEICAPVPLTKIERSILGNGISDNVIIQPYNHSHYWYLEEFIRAQKKLDEYLEPIKALDLSPFEIYIFMIW